MEDPQQEEGEAPVPIVVIARHSHTWQKFHGIPYRRYIELEIVEHGWTQARNHEEIEDIVRDWLACAGEDSHQRMVIAWL